MKLPSQKIIDLILAIAAVIIVAVILIYFGNKVAGVVGVILAFLGLRKTPEDKLEDAKEEIEKAGDEIEKPDKHDADSALDKFDDILNDRDGPG